MRLHVIYIRSVVHSSSSLQTASAVENCDELVLRGSFQLPLIGSLAPAKLAIILPRGQFRILQIQHGVQGFFGAVTS